MHSSNSLGSKFIPAALPLAARLPSHPCRCSRLCQQAQEDDGTQVRWQLLTTLPLRLPSLLMSPTKLAPPFSLQRSPSPAELSRSCHHHQRRIPSLCRQHTIITTDSPLIRTRPLLRIRFDWPDMTSASSAALASPRWLAV